MTIAFPARIDGLHAKRARGGPMVAEDELRLCRERGVVEDQNPPSFSPRQVCIAIEEDLRMFGVSQQGSRANLIMDGLDAMKIESGALLSTANVAVRITMECEPCAHGARLADVPLSRFRQIRRFLGVIARGGLIRVSEDLSLTLGVFPRAPGDFRSRCTWAVDQIPVGRVVTSLELLTAIGASKSYARVLPRWLHDAGVQGSPVHRVVTTGLAAGSWAPDALAVLCNEGGMPVYGSTYPLSRVLWFEERELGDAF